MSETSKVIQFEDAIRLASDMYFEFEETLSLKTDRQARQFSELLGYRRKIARDYLKLKHDDKELKEQLKQLFILSNAQIATFLGIIF